MAPLAPGSLVVIVGITGYIASHIGLEALKAGYRVRGTVRSTSKADEVRAAYIKEGVDVSSDKLTFVPLDDLLDESKFEAVFACADGVIHPALPDLSSPDAVDQIIKSTEIPLRAAAKVGIKRFVLTGTLVSVLTPGTPSIPTDRLITDKDWNDAGVEAWRNATEEQKKSPVFGMMAYAAGKTLGERAAWKFMETQSPPFDLTVVLPSMNFGPKLYGEPATTLAWFAGIMRNETFIINSPPHYIVDVRDDAKLHIVSLSNPETTGKRIWAAAHRMDWNEILGMLRKNFPSVTIPEDRPITPIQPCPFRIDNSLSEKLLGGKWIDLEQTLVDSAKSIGY